MINKAIEKLTKEMMKLNNPFAQAIEEICTSDAVAEKILQEGKSLKGACDSIRDVAKKNAVGGVGAVSDEDAYRMAEEYYGISRVEKHETLNVLDLL